MEGGEVHMWNEQTDPVNLDSRVWPRAAAAAEVLWSGKIGCLEGACGAGSFRSGCASADDLVSDGGQL